MRTRTSLIALGLVAAFGAAVVLHARSAGAEDEKGGGSGMTSLKPVKHPFFDGLVGSWTHESTGAWGTWKGTATFALGIGGTAVTESYESGMEAGKSTFFGHGVYRVSDDGKTVTLWWFDNGTAKPMEATGTLTDQGYDVTGDGPRGKLRMKFEKTDKGYVFTMSSGDSVLMTDTFTRAK